MNEQLTDLCLTDFTIVDSRCCTIQLSEGYQIYVESLARYIDRSGLYLVVQDHNQRFGKENESDIESEIAKRIKNQKITQFTINEETGDLTIKTDQGRLEVITNSYGYESYQIYKDGNTVYVGIGGKQNTEPGSPYNSGQSLRD